MSNPKPSNSHFISHVTSPDPSLPLFVYGALKPSEIGWDFISAEVSHWIEATAEGVALTVSDGVAFARFLNDKSISGALLHFSQPMVSYEKVALFEGLGHKNPRYKWQRVNTTAGLANILIRKGSGIGAGYVSSWASSDDEVFRHGVPWLRGEIFKSVNQLGQHAISDPKKLEYWNAYFRLQAAVLLLWSVQERLEMFRLGITDETRSLSDRRKEFAGTKEFQRALSNYQGNASLSVREYRAPDGNSLEAGVNAINAWYRLRSNIAHHGKGCEREVEKVAISAIDHFNVLLVYFTETQPQLAEHWEDLTFIPPSMYSSRLY